MKSARAKMKAALNEQARHARGEPTQEDREREKYKRYSQSDKGKARYQTYWSSDKGKQVLKQYKTSRKTQQKDDRTKVMELRDVALSIGRPVRDVAPSGKGQTKSKWSQNAVATETALDQQAHSAQGKAAVDIWDMEICNFQDITRAQYRPAGRRAWAVVGIMDGTSGRKEFSGSREGWRVTCKLRDESGITLGVVAFTEQIFWIEEQAALFHDQIVRMGPLKRKENSYIGQMDLHLCYTTKIVSANELPKHIASFLELRGSWPAQAQWEQEKHARSKAEVVNTGDGDIELMVDGDISPTRFQVYGLHPALVDAVAGAKLLVEVFPMVGGGEKISEHSVVRLASS